MAKCYARTSHPLILIGIYLHGTLLQVVGQVVSTYLNKQVNTIASSDISKRADTYTRMRVVTARQ